MGSIGNKEHAEVFLMPSFAKIYIVKFYNSFEIFILLVARQCFVGFFCLEKKFVVYFRLFLHWQPCILHRHSFNFGLACNNEIQYKKLVKVEFAVIKLVKI